MRKSPRPFCRSHDDQDDGLVRICRGARLYGGIPFLILTVFFIAMGREGDLPEFLYWLTLIWMCQIRYVESS